MYDIDDTRTFTDRSYTDLRKNRSERETSVMGRLDVLIRISGEVMGVWGAEEGESGRSTTGLKLGKPSRCVVTHNLEVDDKDAMEWAQEIAKEAGKIEGWVRLRVVRVLESGKTKMEAAVNLDEGDVGRYFVVHGELLLHPCLAWEAEAQLRIRGRGLQGNQGSKGTSNV